LTKTLPIQYAHIDGLMKKLLSSRNNVILLAVLLIGLSLLMVMIRKPQQIITKAAEPDTIDHIEFYYPTAYMEKAELPIYMSAQAMNINNEPIWDQVTYSWGISSPVSLGRLIETNQNISGFDPLNVGSGDIFVTATKNGQSITNSFKMTVVDSFTTTPPPGAYTNINFTVYLHGRGRGGDNTNPTSIGNMNPLNTYLPFTVSFYDNKEELVGETLSQLYYDSAAGKYVSYIQVPSYIPTGLYSMKVETESYLKKEIPGFYLIEPYRSYVVNPVRMITGDALNDNRLDILDYNQVLDCYEDLLPARNCNGLKKHLTDFNDDGYVNQIDFNLFLREISVQLGD